MSTKLRLGFLALAMTGCLLGLGGTGRSANGDVPLGTVVRVEEDWRLVLGKPNLPLAAPQISTQMARSPNATRFCNFHLNACDLPSLVLGGMQLQVWKDSTNLAIRTADNTAILNTANEVITWTQYLRHDAGKLKFGISAAASTTWGDFSGLEVTIPSGLAILDDYDVQYSVDNSGVTFGANRVSALTLLRVRLTYTDGSVSTDDTERVVCSDGQDGE